MSGKSFGFSLVALTIIAIVGYLFGWQLALFIFVGMGLMVFIYSLIVFVIIRRVISAYRRNKAVYDEID